MRALDANRSFGAVMGKAVAPSRKGQSLVPILIALR
jgi:hypothetical protein